MKYITFVLLLFLNTYSFSQNLDSNSVKKELTVILQNGTKYNGQLLYDDGREIKFQDSRKGLVYIPKNFVRDIFPYDATLDNDLSQGDRIATDKIYSNGFVSNHGAVKKSDVYYNGLYGILGFEVVFGVSNRVSIGYASTIALMPSLINCNLNVPINKTTYVGAKLFYGKLLLYDRNRKNDILYGGLAGITKNSKNFTFSINAGVFLNHYKERVYQTYSNYYSYSYNQYANRTDGLIMIQSSLFYRITSRSGFVSEFVLLNSDNFDSNSNYVISNYLKFYTKKYLAVNLGITNLITDKNNSIMFPTVSITKKFNLRELER